MSATGLVPPTSYRVVVDPLTSLPHPQNVLTSDGFNLNL